VTSLFRASALSSKVSEHSLVCEYITYFGYVKWKNRVCIAAHPGSETREKSFRRNIPSTVSTLVSGITTNVPRRDSEHVVTSEF
jgi:hypothetical protein